MPKEIKNIVLEDAQIMFRNFSGKEDKFNPPGKRNFCVFLDDKTSKDLEKVGWNVKYLRPREEGDAPQAYLQVEVKYNYLPPKIVLVTSQGRTPISEDDVGMLDWAEIDKADLIIRPYNWEVNGKTGVKAYVKSLYVTLAEDELDRKYADIPDTAQIVEEDDFPF